MLPHALEKMMQEDKLPHTSMIIGGNLQYWEDCFTAVQKFLAINWVDIHFLTEVPTIKDLRILLEKLYLKPRNSKWTLAGLTFIEDWKMESANTLLKILEEPPVHAKILIFTQDEFSVLPTIRSRALRFYISDNTHQSIHIKSLTEISKQSLAKQIRYCQQLLEQHALVDIVKAWIINTPGWEAEGLKILAYLGKSSNINKRIVLESIIVNYHVRSGSAAYIPDDRH